MSAITHYFCCADDEVEKLDFVSLMTLVADKVSEYPCDAAETNESVKNYLVQMPCVVSTLKKKIYLPYLPKIDQTRASNPEDDLQTEDSES